MAYSTFGGYLRQSTAVTVAMGPMVDATDGFTAEISLTITQPDIRLSKNGAAFAQKNAAGTLSHMENGFYSLPLDTTDTNTVGRLTVHCAESGARPHTYDFMVVEEEIYDGIFASTAGSSTWMPTNVEAWLGTAAATPTVAGVPEVDVTHWQGTTALASSTAGTPAVDVVRINNASAAATNLGRWALVGGAAALTADSGTTTTLVDAALTAADVDYFKGCMIVFSSGTISGQCRLVTAFDPTTDTLTFYPPTTQAVSTNTYAIMPAAPVDNWGLLGSVLATPTVAGVPEVDLTHIAGVANSATTAQIGVNVVNMNNNLLSVQRLQSYWSACLSGTSDSGTTTTMVDAARTEGDADYFKDSLIVFTSGTINGQARRITAFDAATDTITFSPATTQAVSTQTYVIIPAGMVDVGAWSGTANATVDTAGYPVVTVKDGTGVGELNTSNGRVSADVARWNGTVVATENTAGVPIVDLARINGVATTATLDTIKTDTAAILVDTGTTLDAAIADLPTNAELATALGTADDAVLAQVALVKAATDTIADLPTNAELATALGTADDAVLAQIALVKAKTDSLTFTQANVVDAHIQYVAGEQVTGSGTEGDPWGPI